MRAAVVAVAVLLRALVFAACDPTVVSRETDLLGFTAPDVGQCDWAVPDAANKDEVDADLFQRAINVKAPKFGALGDGSNDDTAEIEAALDAATDRRGHFYFPAGTYKITDELVWSQIEPTPASGIGGGALIEGAGPDLTVIDYTGPGCPFVFNDLRGTVGGNVALITVRDLTIKVRSPALCGILITDPTVSLSVQNVRFWGHTAATAVISRGEVSCACHTSFRDIRIRNFWKGFWLSGFSNANRLDEVHTIVTTETGVDISKIGDTSVCVSSGVPFACCTGEGTGTCAGGPVCWAVDEPYDCCTGAGTGSGTGPCNDDTMGGKDNELSRMEEGSGVGLGWNFADGADRNICTKCVADGATASAAIASNSVGNIFVASVLNPDPTGAGVNLTRMVASAYSGNDTTVDAEQVMGILAVRTNTSGATREMRVRMNTSAPYYKLEAAGGADGDRFQIASSTGSTSTAELAAGGAIGVTAQNGVGLLGTNTDSPPTCAAALDGYHYFDVSLGRDCVCSDNNAGAAYKWCPVNDPQTCSGGGSTSCG